MGEEIDIQFMKKAIDLSMKGYGHVSPNPLVGALITKNDELISEGYHQRFGEAHAEANAIRAAQESLEGATMYVTLEPCNHHGKTPPCTDSIIREGIKRVVIGMMDPNKTVSGGGADKLREAGIEVITGVLEDEIEKLNEVFIKYIRTGIPFCALKTAMSLDGKISTHTGDSKWITNERSRKLVHQLRQRYSAVMTGINTVIKDDPLLTVRTESGLSSHPLRIVVDSAGRTPMDAKILNSPEAKTIIAVTQRAGNDFIESVREKGAEVIVCPEIDKRVDLSHLVRKLGEKGIDSILIEAGGELNFSALRQGIVDKVYTFIASKMIGGKNANTPMGGAGFEKLSEAASLKITAIEKIKNDILIEAYISGK